MIGKSLNESKCPIVIFGASVVGEAVIHWCFDNCVKIAAICDNNTQKQGTEVLGVKVIAPESLPQLFPNAWVIICVNDIADIVKQLAILGCETYVAGGDILRDVDIYRYEYSKPQDFVAYVANTCILSHDSFKHPDKIFIRSVDVVITERCSLRCKDCSNLMQYYQKPENYDVKSVMDDIDRLCVLCDDINEFRIIGGEPLMNPHWDEIVSHAIGKNNVHKVIIYSNGTILPTAEQLTRISDSKLMWLITDYGELSRNIDDLCNQLTVNGIAYVRTPVGNWSDCSKIAYHHRSNEDTQRLFNLCCVKNSFTLMRGHLYRCPFSGNADVLRAIPDSPVDRFDIRTIEANRQSLSSFLSRNQFIEACNYCLGRPWGAPTITPAIQYKEKPQYLQFPR